MKELNIPELLALIPVLIERETVKDIYKKHKVLMFTLQISEDELTALLARTNQSFKERNDYYNRKPAQIGLISQSSQYKTGSRGAFGLGGIKGV